MDEPYVRAAFDRLRRPRDDRIKRRSVAGIGVMSAFHE